MISICKKLLLSNVSMLENHTYVSVRQRIADYLGKGNLLSTIPSKSNEIQTERFIQIFSRNKKRAAKYSENISYDSLMIITAVE